MDLDKFNELLSLESVRKQIFEIKAKYHPNLIANLSKEAYDLYIIRDSICESLLKLLEEKDINLAKIKRFVKEKIKSREQKLKNTKDKMEIEFIQNSIKEWKKFL